MYERCALEHFRQNRQMLFLMGPRQVGKTFVGLSLKDEWPLFYYYTWDEEQHQQEILAGNTNIANRCGLPGIVDHAGAPMIVFDEIHKHRGWKNFLKGLYDTYPFKSHILVTGSARLDVYKRGSDSLMGRYFRYRVHPLSIRELLEPDILPESLRTEPKHLSEDLFDALWEFGGFPDPFLKAEKRFHRQWNKLRRELLFRDDLRDLSRVQEIAQMELLAELMRRQVGQKTSLASLAKKIRIAHTTVSSWLKILESLYYCFPIRPWSKNLSRSLLKEPKYYLIDWSLVDEAPARAENFIASHLLKAVHFWNDHGVGDYDLYYLKDKDQREVDFLVARGGKPWLMIEVKQTNSRNISSSLHHFRRQLEPDYALQVVIDKPYDDVSCFTTSEPRSVSARTFLSQLV